MHAQLNTAIACGALPGIHQTAPRAEICAAIAAARWALTFDLPCIVWTDAQNVFDGVAQIQDGDGLPGCADGDLWAVLASFLEQLPASRFLVRHTPSHLDQQLTEEPFEDWLAEHNAHADLLAGLCNQNRPQVLVETHAAALRYHHETLRLIRAFRAMFFAIAEHQSTGVPAGAEPAVEDAEVLVPAPGAVLRRLDLEETLPLNWRQHLDLVSCGLPGIFIQQVCDFLFGLDGRAEEAYHLSWLEVVFLLHDAGQYPYPVCDASGRWQDPASLVFSPPEHTVAVRLSLVRRALRPALRGLGLQGMLVQGIDLSFLGVRFALDGLVIGVPTTVLLRARASVGRFVQGRAACSKGVLARPI